MPYVMPQQVKEKAGDRGTVFRESTGTDITFVRANHRCCFIEYAVDELMAVFCAERFRQFDRFVNGHFVWHIATFRQLVQRNAQYCFSTAQFFQQAGQVWLHQSVEVCGVSRHPASSSRKYRTSTSFTSCSAGNWYSTSAMSFWDNCRSRAHGRHTHERGDEQQVSRISPY